MPWHSGSTHGTMPMGLPWASVRHDFHEIRERRTTPNSTALIRAALTAVSTRRPRWRPVSTNCTFLRLAASLSRREMALHACAGGSPAQRGGVLLPPRAPRYPPRHALPTASLHFMLTYDGYPDPVGLLKDAANAETACPMLAGSRAPRERDATLCASIAPSVARQLTVPRIRHSAVRAGFCKYTTSLTLSETLKYLPVRERTSTRRL